MVEALTTLGWLHCPCGSQAAPSSAACALKMAPGHLADVKAALAKVCISRSRTFAVQARNKAAAAFKDLARGSLLLPLSGLDTSRKAAALLEAPWEAEVRYFRCLACYLQLVLQSQDWAVLDKAVAAVISKHREDDRSDAMVFASQIQLQLFANAAEAMLLRIFQTSQQASRSTQTKTGPLNSSNQPAPVATTADTWPPQLLLRLCSLCSRLFARGVSRPQLFLLSHKISCVIYPQSSAKAADQLHKTSSASVIDLSLDDEPYIDLSLDDESYTNAEFSDGRTDSPNPNSCTSDTQHRFDALDLTAALKWAEAAPKLSKTEKEYLAKMVKMVSANTNEMGFSSEIIVKAMSTN